jgi:plastocyanin
VKSRRTLLAVGGLAAMCASAFVIAPAVAQAPAKLDMIGGVTVKPGKFVKDSQRFSPMNMAVKSGRTVRLRSRTDTPDPHTISFVRRSDLPKKPAEVFECEACGPFFAAHEANEETGDVGKPVVDVGATGVDQPGDSIFVPPDGTVRFDVTADAGRTLYYLCAIHPWMQGKFRVVR